MNLRINNIDNHIILEGDLNEAQVNSLKKEMKALIKATTEAVIINLSVLTNMDREGARALEKLHLFAIKCDKELHLIGKENTQITAMLKKTPLNFIVLRKEFAAQLVA